MNYRFTIVFVCACVSFFSTVVGARAAEFSLGGGVAAATSPYKSHDANILVSPFASVAMGRVYLEPAAVGVHLVNNDTHTLGAEMTYSWFEFDPDDCDDGGMRRLDKRRSTLMAGLAYSVRGAWGMAKVRLSHDILGRSNGAVGEASYHVPVRVGRLDLVPGAGVTWSSEKQADYYFGVTRAESVRSGVQSHEAGSSLSPFVRLEAKYTLGQRWSVVASAEARLLTGSVKNSPMVGRSATVSGALGVLFTF
ncbi:MAG: MipA/OmpV family protein [Planctomycetes bacterium]|nr:MipA/OmpV family protein [Planctomycetota bacterium]